MNPVLSQLFFLFCKSFFKIYCPLHVKGKENLPQSSFILCSNHCSHMDTPALMIATGLPFNNFGMIAAKDYFFATRKHKSMAALFMNLIPINRKCARYSLFEDIALCKQFVSSKQKNLIIYPEGTRSLTGDMRSFKTGTAMLAHELKIPVVPAYIKGTYQALGKGKYFPRPSQITVSIGQPLTVDKAAAHINYKKEWTSLLEQTINQLKATIQD